jgi:Right handed beta helix region
MRRPEPASPAAWGLRVLKRRVVVRVALVAALAAVALGSCHEGDLGADRLPMPSVTTTTPSLPHGTSDEAGTTTAMAVGSPVCGTDRLRSPYTYAGPAGPFRSGTGGLPTYGRAGTDFPRARAGRVIAPGTGDFANWELEPNTVYYLAPGVHHRSILASKGDVFVGGYAAGRGSVLDGGYGRATAIDSNITVGEQTGVTIQYLTIQRFTPPVDQTAINQTGAGGWRLLDSTVTLNVPGGGMFAATDAVLRRNCLTLNGQYGFQAAQTVRGDSLTGGPYNVWVEENEISYNDTCGLSGLLQNEALGWHDHNPVPERYRNPRCGAVEGTGNQGGFKLWATNGVMIRGNWIHHNWGVGGWADSNNANTTWVGNTITDNENGGIWEETSYNFSITDNHLARNNLTDGPGNPSFPMPAIYISESGSDSRNGGVPPCTMPSCLASGVPGYPEGSKITGNTLVDNGGGVFLWQNSDRHCNDGYDAACTLTRGGEKGPFSTAGCAVNLPGADLDRTKHIGQVTGSPPHDYWYGCMWATQNVTVSKNRIEFDPAAIPGCTEQAWPACGANGIFSKFGGPNEQAEGADVPTQLTFFQGNRWHDNVYDGPSTFYAWSQGNPKNPVSWAQWSAPLGTEVPCTAPTEESSGACTGPFGQDAGSVFHP